MTVDITLRQVKGAPLTFDEVDDNFSNLKAAADSASGDLSAIESDVTGIDARLTTAEGEIDTLQSAATTLTVRVDAIEADYTTESQAESIADNAIAAHVALADPHTQYLTGAESVNFAATKSAGDTLAALLADGATVIVDEDEAATPVGVQTRRTVLGGALSAIASFLKTSMIAWKHGGTGAVWRTLYARLMDLPVSVKDFGAVGDGVTDDTAAIQAAITALSTGGTLDGLGLEYVVTSLNLKSRMTLQNTRLKTKAGSTDFVAPITIDGQSSAKSDIFIFNVHVNGNRQNQTAIDSPAEDGGRHGFRILGFVSNLTVKDSSAIYCGGDGLQMFSNNSKPATDDYNGLCFQNIVVENCVFDWNRRHGFVFDSAQNIKIINCDARNNGKDLNGTDPLNSGNRGARFLGNLYGRGFDVEGYGVGSAIKDFEVRGGVFTDNIGGALIFDGVNPSAMGFLPRTNIRISNARFDAPASSGEPSFLVFASSVSGTSYAYKNITISNCQFDNWFRFKGVDGVSVSGGSVVADYAGNSFYALVEVCKNWKFNTNPTKPSVVFDAMPFTVTRANIIGSPTFSSETTDLRGFTANGWVMEYRGLLTAAVDIGYYLTFTVSTNYKIRLISGSFGSTEPKTEKFNIFNDRDGTFIGFNFDISGTGNREVVIRYEVVPNGA